MRFSCGRITTSMGCRRRSTLVTAAFRKPDTELVAVARRTLSRPAEIDGIATPTMSPTMHITTSISSSVMPRRPPLLAFPTDNIGCKSLSPRLAVLAQRHHIRLVAVIAREFVQVIVTPGVLGNLLGDIRAGPLLHIGRFGAQCLQSLLRGGVSARVQLVGCQGRHEAVDIGARLGHLGGVGVLHHVGGNQRGEQGDDGHDHQHFDERDAGLSAGSFPLQILIRHWIATSLMLVIASSMLRIRVPTITPITRITMGSKTEVKRLMAERVSVSYMSAMRANIVSRCPVSSPTVSR